jgi:hypothetical protein
VRVKKVSAMGIDRSYTEVTEETQRTQSQKGLRRAMPQNNWYSVEP